MKAIGAIKHQFRTNTFNKVIYSDNGKYFIMKKNNLKSYFVKIEIDSEIIYKFDKSFELADETDEILCFQKGHKLVYGYKSKISKILLKLLCQNVIPILARIEIAIVYDLNGLANDLINEYGTIENLSFTEIKLTKDDFFKYKKVSKFKNKKEIVKLVPFYDIKKLKKLVTTYDLESVYVGDKIMKFKDFINYRHESSLPIDIDQLIFELINNEPSGIKFINNDTNLYRKAFEFNDLLNDSAININLYPKAETFINGTIGIEKFYCGIENFNNSDKDYSIAISKDDISPNLYDWIKNLSKKVIEDETN